MLVYDNDGDGGHDIASNVLTQIHMVQTATKLTMPCKYQLYENNPRCGYSMEKFCLGRWNIFGLERHNDISTLVVNNETCTKRECVRKPERIVTTDSTNDTTIFCFTSGVCCYWELRSFS